MVTFFFFGLGKSGTFIANRIELNLNTSQVDTSNESANALIYINLTTGALSDFLKHVINRLLSNLFLSTYCCLLSCYCLRRWHHWTEDALKHFAGFCPLPERQVLQDAVLQ